VPSSVRNKCESAASRFKGRYDLIENREVVLKTMPAYPGP
jgi:hypothetical protein